MFERTCELDKAVKIMNSIEEGKFPLMLNRIAQFLAADTASKPFTDAEELKLENSLEIPRDEVQLVISSIIDIFGTCAYHKAKPQVLTEQFQSVLGLSRKKTEDFVNVWTSFAKVIVDNMKQKSFLPQLHHVVYTLSIGTASDSESCEKSLRAQLQLGLSNNKIQEDVSIEFTHDELFNFYKKLEQIQVQLDSLK